MDSEKLNLECNILMNDNSSTTKQILNNNLTPSITNIETNLINAIEKCDRTPENAIKVDEIPDIIQSNPETRENKKNESDDVKVKDEQKQTTKEEQKHNLNISNSVSLQEMKLNEKIYTNELKIEEDLGSESSRPNSFAFVIDFNDNKVVDKKKYNNLIERFQTRHVRGKSLSKIDNSPKSNVIGGKSETRSVMSAKLPRKNKVEAHSTETTDSEDKDSRSGVNLRNKTNQNKDISKRHSWGPRTSTLNNHENLKIISNTSTKINNKNIPPKKSDNKRNEKTLNLELICPEPPLENFKQLDDEVVSEAGTYTLDGDNYTEEQKEKMNIDKINCNTVMKSDSLEIIDLDENYSNDCESNRKNILEISVYHNEAVTNVKPKVSYLDKIKSRVKNIGERKLSKNSSKSPENFLNDDESSDMGTFTSVTTSGILSKKPTLEQNPRITRKNSLTKSQIDASEYVQGVSRLNINSENIDTIMKNNSSSYTSDSNHGDDELEIKRNYNKKINNCDDLGNKIKVAATKNDWIQEWAKYAREYAQKNPISPMSSSYHQMQDKNKYSGISKGMSRSYDFENYNNGEYDENHSNLTNTDYLNYDEEFGDNLERSYINKRNNNNVERYRNIGNYNYSSETNLKYYEKKANDSKQHPYDYNNSNQHWMFGKTTKNNNLNSSNNLNISRDSDNENVYCVSLNLTSNRPPMSPSKIPSPIHSISRARSNSKTRNQNELNMNETEMYLQKTAAAINTLQNIHRQNSLNNSPKSPSSPSHKISPKISPVHHASIMSPKRLPSPYNSILPNDLDDNYKQIYRNMHHRNLSLDGSDIKISFQNDQVDRNLYDVFNLNKSHTRHHSYEGMMKNKFDQTNNESNNVTMKTRGMVNFNNTNNSNNNSNVCLPNDSPIRRSNSFSTKNVPIQKYSNKTVVNTAMTSGVKQNNPLKKSASSTSFRKMLLGTTDPYEDGNQEFGYYINDDELIDDRQNFSSGSELSDVEPEPKEQITTTRYNKTALMRVEHSKKQITGTGQGKQGVIACPNTPEFRRRDNTAIRQSFRDRQSMPRDSSLSRLKQDLPNLNQTKKNLTTNTLKDKVLPKYMDISKYKQQGAGANFLRKDESKSYLINKEVKRSPSSASMNLCRNDATRTSNRSIKSAGARPNPMKKEPPAQKSKEAELALWKRRASYDPMKAANEAKKKLETAKRQAQQSKLNDSSAVLRSQSFHSGVTSNIGIQMNGSDDGANFQNKNRWTTTSTESSDEEFIMNS